jgi:hypothetical protein
METPMEAGGINDTGPVGIVSIDEVAGKIELDKIPALKPVFKKTGTITARIEFVDQRRGRFVEPV